MNQLKLVKIIHLFHIHLFPLGSLNDASIWSNTKINTALENNTVSLPPELYLPHTNIAVPFALVGDEGFPLKKVFDATVCKKKFN